MSREWLGIRDERYNLGQETGDRRQETGVSSYEFRVPSSKFQGPRSEFRISSLIWVFVKFEIISSGLKTEDKYLNYI